MKKLVFLFFVLPVVLMAPRCTVSYSTSGADIPAAANTFSVRTFQLATPMASPLYNQVLTESFKDLMLRQTRLDLVDKKGDLQFDGVVTAYNTGNAAVSGDELATINRLTITVKVNYVNTFEREKNFEKTFTRWADFPSTQDFAAVEGQLVEEINEQLIQDIFDASLGAW